MSTDGEIEEVKHWREANNSYLDHAKNLSKERLVVSAVIVANKKVLLLRRSPDDSFPGTWEFPGGGVEDNDRENIVDALRREVEEEAGLTLPTFPTGEVLSHPTRTALRVVLRFDIESEREIKLSHEHDAWVYLDVAGAEITEIDGVNVLDAMREENQGIMHLVASDSND